DLLAHFNRELHKKFTGFTVASADMLQKYSWPGNIRELKNVVERTMILAPEGDVHSGYLPQEIRDYQAEGKIVLDADQGENATERRFLTLREIEDNYVEQVLSATQYNKTAAARILGIHPTSLLRRLKKSEA